MPRRTLSYFSRHPPISPSFGTGGTTLICSSSAASPPWIHAVGPGPPHTAALPAPPLHEPWPWQGGVAASCILGCRAPLPKQPYSDRWPPVPSRAAAQSPSSTISSPGPSPDLPTPRSPPPAHVLPSSGTGGTSCPYSPFLRRRRHKLHLLLVRRVSSSDRCCQPGSAAHNSLARSSVARALARAGQRRC